MKEFAELSRTIGGLPVNGLVALVILAAFALAAYAIHAVSAARKEKG